jgi:hypothetical protein
MAAVERTATPVTLATARAMKVDAMAPPLGWPGTPPVDHV